MQTLCVGSSRMDSKVRPKTCCGQTNKRLDLSRIAEG